MTRESATIDLLDRQVIHALQHEPRAPYSRIADILAVSEQTVARRYRRLRGGGVLRVIGLVDPRRLGQTAWTVRLQCRPDSTIRLAQALARRDDVGWVTLTAGGSEVICLVRSTTRAESEELLLSKLPNTSQVLSLTALATLHQFRGGASDDWIGEQGVLSQDQLTRLRSARPAVDPAREVAVPEAADRPLLDALGRDGRASIATLAAASGWTETRTARRLDALLAGGVVYLDVDVAMAAVGFMTAAYLWLAVDPAHLAAAGEAIATHPEVPYAAAVTGSANLVASVACRDLDALYAYVTTKIGAIEGVRQVEISPVLRRIKQAGALLDGGRLAEPAPPARSR